MKSLLRSGLVLLSLGAAASLAAQEGTPGHHTHTGFYLSLNPGIAVGKTVQDAGYEVTYKGGGSALELRIGGAVKENLILSFDLITRAVSEPEVETDAPFPVGSGDDQRLSDHTAGLGVTWYFMPHNVFVSGTLGMGFITLVNTSTDNGAATDAGLALSLKVGKEWWVSKNWGLGVSGGYGYVGGKGGDFSGDLKSNKLFVLFNTTYN